MHRKMLSKLAEIEISQPHGCSKAAIVVENEQQPADSTKETTCSPPQNKKTRSLKEIYEQAPDEHLQYALFSSRRTLFEEALNDA